MTRGILAALIPMCGFLLFFAPSVLGAFVILVAMLFGTCIMDRLVSGFGVWLKTAIHGQSIKPPANLVTLGVILSVVFAIVGFSWNANSIGIQFPPCRYFFSIFSIVGHFLCLGAFVGLLSTLQHAPNFRSSRG